MSSRSDAPVDEEWVKRCGNLGLIRKKQLRAAEREWLAIYSLKFGPEAASKGLQEGEVEFFDEMGKALWPHVTDGERRHTRAVDIVLTLRRNHP